MTSNTRPDENFLSLVSLPLDSALLQKRQAARADQILDVSMTLIGLTVCIASFTIEPISVTVSALRIMIG